ncbi:hypothetical protein HW560_17985 [Paenibacillus sp. E222]|uniref:hypothetical protein n=1 Tax=Paenibacillus sp. E222 TaxID=2748863 RepID=UPI0015C63CC3|nr:hypothetical protein [Paenibacillus sp. E222]QLG39812.1 hypothetical protein HW560_17985 [Paenibacillus sp. E222]
MQQQWMEMVNHVVEWGKGIPWCKGFQGAKETVEFACSCLEFILFAKAVKDDNNDPKPPQLPLCPPDLNMQSRRSLKRNTKYRRRNRKLRK